MRSDGDENLMEIDPDEQLLGDQGEQGREGDQGGTKDKADGDKAKPDKADDTLKEMRRALKETRTALRETSDTAKFWMQQARAAGVAPKEKPEETKVTVDLVEAITNGDAKAIAKGLRELGVAFDRDVDGKIHAARQGIGQDAELYGRFPDLEDEQSPLFKATAKIYADLERRDPQLAKSGLLAEIAAELADKRLGGGGGDREEPARGRKARGEEYEVEVEDDDDDDAAERERDRIARVRAQSGGRGRGARRTGDGAGGGRDDDSLNATQKTIVAKLKAAGADISEDGYRKRALSGVRMSGLPTRRPRY